MQNFSQIVLKKFVEWKEDILHLLYPSNCLICDRELSKNEAEICFGCQPELHFTGYEKYADASQLDKLFWGRCQVESTFSLLYFEQEGGTQKILHELKYKGKQKLGLKMGQLMSEKLLENPKYASIDALIPVPLHPKKLHARGYNQSELLAQGLSEYIQTPLNTNFLKRVVHAESQTKKGRFLRWDNIESAFQVEKSNQHDFKHIALIDDVVTTGSTIESCIREIQNVHPDLKISVISLAVTK